MNDEPKFMVFGGDMPLWGADSIPEACLTLMRYGGGHVFYTIKRVIPGTVEELPPEWEKEADGWTVKRYDRYVSRSRSGHETDDIEDADIRDSPSDWGTWESRWLVPVKRTPVRYEEIE